MRTNQLWCCALLAVIMATAAAIQAQRPGTPELPIAVTRLITTETIAVGRVDLRKLDIGNAMPLIAEWGRLPPAEAAAATAMLLNGKQTILNAGGTELFVIASLDGLPTNVLTLVLPVTSADQIGLVKRLFSGRDVQVADQAVLVQLGKPTSGQANPRSPLGEGKRSELRPEFAQALQSVERLPIQLAMALSADGRRVVREMFPQRPGLFGEFTGPLVSDGVRWLSLGLDLGPKPAVEVVVQSQDAESATRLQAAVTTGLKALSNLEGLKTAPLNVKAVLELLVPHREADRLLVALNESNGGADRLINDVLKPLARKSQQTAGQHGSVNNLKMLGLALHNYHDTHKTFPPSATTSRDGGKLLSWRVHLLPYVEAQDLYKQFHLDEPWDSEHNKKLIPQMPAVFASPLAPATLKSKGMTTYVAPIAEGTVFSKSTGVALGEIIDGTSNTILIVEVNPDHAVVWTKPDDLRVDLLKPTKGLEGQPDGTFRAVFADGSARAIRTTVAPETLRRLMQMNDGEAIGEF